MSISTSATLNYQIQYNQTDLQNGVRVNDLASTGYSVNLSSNNTGTGNPTQTGVVSFVYANTLSIPSGTTLALDLTSLQRTFLNSLVTSSLASGRLMSLYVYNPSNAYIHVKTTGSNAFNDVNAGGTGLGLIFPQSPFFITSAVSGLPVSSTKRLVHFVNPGPSGNLDVLILGISRTGT